MNLIQNYPLNLLNILLERVPMGVAIFDRDLILQRCNPLWVRFTDGYNLSATRRVQPGVYFYDLLPDTAPMLQPLFDRVLDGETLQEDGFRLSNGGISFFWDLSLTPFVRNDDVIGFVLVMTDATDRELAYQLLREREAQYLSIFESTTDGLIIYNLDGQIVETNPAASQLYGYSREELLGLNWKDLLPTERHALVDEALARIRLGGGKFLTQGLNIRKNGAHIHVEAHGVPFSYRGHPHALVVVRDVTQQVRAYQLLEQRVEERTRELSTLLEISNRVASRLKLPLLLQEILDQLKTIIDYGGAAIFLYKDPGELHCLIYRGPIPERDVVYIYPLDSNRIYREVIEQRRAIIIPNTRADTPSARAFQEMAGKHIVYRQSWMGVPLIVRDQIIGVISFDHEHINHYAPRHANLAQSFANQVAIAIENARLYEEVEERTRELSTLLELTYSFASTLEVRPLLQIVLEQVKSVVDYSFASILMLNGEEAQVMESKGLPPELRKPQTGRIRVLYHEVPVLNQIVETRQPVIIPDVFADDHLANTMREVRTQNPNSTIPYIRCWMGVPLVIRDEVIGILSLDHKELGFYNLRHARLVLAFANQVAIAIENAQLYEQARELATLHERQRLARELHDAVTQTLFSASLIAEVLPFLWQENIEEGQRRLDDLQRLTRGALAEMRSLLLELRPAGLIETPLSDLLKHLVDAISGRTRLKVSLDVQNPRILPADVQIVFYRIAQEALNNVIKHAKANHVTVQMIYQPETVYLSIQDNGRGFDRHNTPADHLGLLIMQERAESIDAKLSINSQENQGTHIAITWEQKESLINV